MNEPERRKYARCSHRRKSQRISRLQFELGSHYKGENMKTLGVCMYYSEIEESNKDGSL